MNFSFQSLPNRSGFPHLILTFANSLDPETCKVRRSFGPYLDQNCLTLWCYFQKDILIKVILNMKKIL